MLPDTPIEIETAPLPDASIIWLHGLGADGGDFVPIVPDLELPASCRVRFVFPHAPHRPVTLNAGYVMRAWYDIYDIAPDAPQDVEGIAATAHAVRGLIEREHARGVAYDRIVLAGFSQGGSMALHTALHFPYRLAGVLALSTWLPLAAEAAPLHTANEALPVFMAHGRDDTVVPLTLGQRSHALLQALGVCVEWHVYPMGHSVIPEEIADIGRWLAQRLA